MHSPMIDIRESTNRYGFGYRSKSLMKVMPKSVAS